MSRKTKDGTGGATTKGPPLRQQLIDRSIEILERKGLEALTLRAAARAAGVSHMAPYRHFADKDALLAAVAARGFSDLGRDMARAAGRKQAESNGLQAIGKAYLKFARRRPALYRLMFGPSLTGRERFPDLDKAGSATFAHCAEAVAAALSRKRNVRDTDIEAAAVATWALVHGLASLLIDGRVALPAGARAEERLISNVLSVYRRVFE